MNVTAVVVVVAEHVVDRPSQARGKQVEVVHKIACLAHISAKKESLGLRLGETLAELSRLILADEVEMDVRRPSKFHGP